MKVLIGSDHAGYRLKENLRAYLSKMNYEVNDYGAFSEESCDYPTVAHALSKDVVDKNARGILICGSGIGMSMAANKVKGVRAALCADEYTAQLSRQHNDSNVLCMGARTLEKDEAKKIVMRWLTTDFSKEERHSRRVGQISRIEG